MRYNYLYIMKSFIIFEKKLVLKADGSLPDLVDLEKIKSLNTFSDYFEEKNFGLRVLELKSADNIPEGFVLCYLRQYFARHSEEENFMAFRAKALVNWRKSTKYCGVCGGLFENHKTLTARQCPKCGSMVFPRINPCIIVKIMKGEKVLLAKSVNPNQDYYALVAGYIEAGESAEHAVAREVLEETGLKVKNITYRGSQSWPFPEQLMLGFTAEYESGDINIQREELADAQWFDLKNCPVKLPGEGSIAYRLLNGLI